MGGPPALEDGWGLCIWRTSRTSDIVERLPAVCDAFRRLRSEEDIRSNIHAGGKKAKADVDSRALRIAEIVRPKLVADGMFMVGLDIVGDKLMEINVFSPGGLGSAQSFENVNFANAVIESLERKVQYMGFYQRNFNNVDMATL